MHEPRPGRIRRGLLRPPPPLTALVSRVFRDMAVATSATSQIDHSANGSKACGRGREAARRRARKSFYGVSAAMLAARARAPAPASKGGDDGYIVLVSASAENTDWRWLLSFEIKERSLVSSSS